MRSEPAPIGGEVLVTELGEVSLLQVIEAVEGTTDTNRCVLEDLRCTGAGPCALHQPWSRSRVRLTDELSGTPLSDLTPGPGRR